MTRPRLVVVEGPDVGSEFEIPDAGGGIGRGEANFARLTDLSVSRSQCAVEVRDARCVLVEPAGRNTTRVNGVVVTEHALVEGDEIGVGATRLVFLPQHGRMPLIVSPAQSTVTMEIPARLLLGDPPHAEGPRRAADQARAHLSALTLLGEALRGAPDAAGIAAAACASLRGALGAARALLFLRDASGALSVVGSSVDAGDAAGAKLQVGRDALEKLLRESRVLLLAPSSTLERAALAAPIPSSTRGRDAPGLLYADQTAGAAPWGETDLELAACVAHLAGAAFDAASARDALLRDSRAFEDRSGASRVFVGKSSAAVEVLARAAKVAKSDTTVLLLGESGSGKELVASEIHRSSRRARGPFVAVNCAALTETVLESELFGHERGAFTGAVDRKIGRFELADGGTLFLDEVGEISLRCQGKFLRALEERRFERVGGTRSVAVDVRVVAATNRDLEAMMRRGEFRDDLYYRLSVIRIALPALRERPDDVPILCDYLLERLRCQASRRVVGIAPDALAALVAYPWPGNVRELRNAIEHALVLGEGDRIRLADLPHHIVHPARRARGSIPPVSREAPSGVPSEPAPARGPRPLRELEREAIVEAMAATHNNKLRAAALLEIDRSTLYKKLKDYGIEG